MILILARERGSAGDREAFDDALRRLTAVELYEGVWLIESSDGPTALRESLKGEGFADESFFIARLERQWAGRKLEDSAAEWLKSREDW